MKKIKRKVYLTEEERIEKKRRLNRIAQKKWRENNSRKSMAFYAKQEKDKVKEVNMYLNFDYETKRKKFTEEELMNYRKQAESILE